MKKNAALYILMFFAWGTVVSHAGETPPPKQSVNPEIPPSDCVNKIGDHTTIDSFFFGLSEKIPDGGYRYKPTRQIPLIVGQEYGWRLTFKTTKSPLHYVETYTLDKPVPAWPGLENVPGSSVSPDKKTASLPGEIPAGQNAVEGFWTISTVDNPGRHVITVSFENETACKFSFEVVPAPSPPSR